jgi:hypothetical protein
MFPWWNVVFAVVAVVVGTGAVAYAINKVNHA